VFAHPITVNPWRSARPIRAFGAGVTAGVMALTLLLTGVQGATAQTSDPSVAQLQSEVDAINSKYFSALAEYTAADVAVKDNETVVTGLKAKAARAKALARERALLAYKSSGAGLAAIVAGSDTLDAAKRAHLIDQVNQRDRSAYKSFRATAKELKAKQAALRDARARQEQSLADLKQQASALDAKLPPPRPRPPPSRRSPRPFPRRTTAAPPAPAPTTTTPSSRAFGHGRAAATTAR
jgi:peptidoglycan hydrolase CwlO-like protein